VEFQASDNLSEQIAQYLSQRIIRMELSPGERLIETRLASDLGVSRAPVREALRILERMRLVEILPRRGASVAPMSIPGIERLCDVLKELLALVARRGVENGDEEDFQKQRIAIRELRDAAEHGDIPGYLEATVQYLVISLKATKNPLLEQILLDIWPLVSRVQYAALTMEKKKLKSNVSYFAAATDHFHNRKAEEAAQVIRELVDHVRDRAVEFIKKKGWDKDQ